MGRADNDGSQYRLTPGPRGHVVTHHTWPPTATGRDLGYGFVSGARRLFFV